MRVKIRTEEAKVEQKKREPNALEFLGFIAAFAFLAACIARVFIVLPKQQEWALEDVSGNASSATALESNTTAVKPLVDNTPRYNFFLTAYLGAMGVGGVLGAASWALVEKMRNDADRQRNKPSYGSRKSGYTLSGV